MRIRGVIFDLGHTLIELPADPESLRREMHAAAQKALSHHGIRVDEQAFEAALERWTALRYGRWQEDWQEYPLVDTFARALAELGCPGTPEALLRETVRAFLAPQEARWRLFPDALPTLDQLKRRGYRLALLTNSGDIDHSWRLIERFGLRPYFDPIVISAAVGWRKPHPALFKGIAAAWGLPSEAVAVVGDLLEADIRGAHLAGMRGIWAAMVARTSASTGAIRPDAIVWTLSEIPAVLDRWADGGET
ncbi:MAG: HAD family hydrolase [Thermoflexus sp.]|jgi:putative hydrolase of the HAD superfamily|nr:HAD family hydrolase [Thermoflexus sp.]